jgi:hypothetical protein
MQQVKLYLMQNLSRHKWEEYNLENIIGGKTADNIPLLKLFLQDYSKLFHTTTLNAGCQKCLKEYLTNYKNKINKMENPNTSQYRLKPKYQNIPLEFGSNIFVNNNNITDEYAQTLLMRYSAEKIFDVYPTIEVVVETKEIEETTETTTEIVEKPKQTRKKRR